MKLIENIDATELAGGDLIDKLNAAIAEVAGNVLDSSTPPKAPRKILAEITFRPDGGREVLDVSIDVSTKLAKRGKSTEAILFLSQDRKTGAAVVSAKDPRQVDMFQGEPAEIGVER